MVFYRTNKSIFLLINFLLNPSLTIELTINIKNLFLNICLGLLSCWKIWPNSNETLVYTSRSKIFDKMLLYITWFRLPIIFFTDHTLYKKTFSHFNVTAAIFYGSGRIFWVKIVYKNLAPLMLNILILSCPIIKPPSIALPSNYYVH